MDNRSLVGAMENNVSEDAVRVKFEELFSKELVAMFRSNFDLYTKIDKNDELKDYVNRKMFDFIYDKVRSGALK